LNSMAGSASFVKGQATAASFLVVFHQSLAQSFSKIGLVVVVLERPDHGKYFAGVRAHELLGIVTEDQANHFRSSLRANLPIPDARRLAATRLHFAHITL